MVLLAIHSVQNYCTILNVCYQTPPRGGRTIHSSTVTAQVVI